MSINELNIGSRFQSNKKHFPPSKNTDYRHDLRIISNHSGEIDKIKLNNEINPLSGIKMQSSFKGGFFYKTKPTVIPENVVKYTLDLAGELGPQYRKSYEKSIKEFHKAIKEDPGFRKRLYLPTESLENAEKNICVGLPEKNVLHRFSDEVFGPFNKLLKRTYSKEKLAILEKQDRLIKDYSAVEEFCRAVEGRDKKFRSDYGLEGVNPDNILIPMDVIKEKVIRKRSTDIKNDNYSLQILNASNRLVSGVIAAVFLGVDALNTTLYLTKDKNKADKEGTTRFMQEMGRLAITVLLSNVITGTFKKESNKSMKVALATTGAGILLAEVAGRWLVGKPILPTTKERIIELDTKAKNRTGISAAVGNLLSGEFLIKNKKSNSIESDKNVNSSSENKSESLQSKADNTVSSNKPPVAVSFTGKFHQIVTGKEAAPVFCKATQVSNIVKIFREIDPEFAAWVEKNVIDNLRLHQPEVYKQVIKKNNLNPNAESSKLREHFDSIMNAIGDSDIHFGAAEHKGHRWMKSFLAPVYWITDLGTWLIKTAKKPFAKKMTIHDKLQEAGTNLEKKGLTKQFENYLNTPNIKTIMEKTSLNKEEIKLKLMEEFLELKGGKLNDNMAGIRHAFSWLKENIANIKDSNGKKLKLTPEEYLDGLNNNKYKKELKGLQDKLFKNFKKIDGRAEKGYSMSVYSVWNYPVTKGVSTAFIVSDIYNLSMLHSGGDKDVSRENAKNRTTQELSRILWSQYTINLTQNGIFKHAYDKFLKVAIGTVALNGVMRETLSRSVVNVPITPKSYDELVDIEKKNSEAKGPIKGTMAKIMGKKSIYKSSSKEEKTPVSVSKPKSEFTASA